MIRKKFKRAVTDSGREVRRAEDKPGVTNLIDIMSVATGRAARGDRGARSTAPGYGQFKEAVGEAVVGWSTPVQAALPTSCARTRASCGGCSRIGAEKARAASAPTLEAMYERMGFVRRLSL